MKNSAVTKRLIQQKSETEIREEYGLKYIQYRRKKIFNECSDTYTFQFKKQKADAKCNKTPVS